MKKGTEDKVKLEKQHRKKPYTRNVKPSLEDYTPYQLQQIASANIDPDMSIDEAAKYVYFNTICVKGYKYTFAERHYPDSRLGHNIEGIKCILERLVNLISGENDCTSHGLEKTSKLMEEMFKKGEFQPSSWLQALAAQRSINASKVVEQIVIKGQRALLNPPKNISKKKRIKQLFLEGI